MNTRELITSIKTYGKHKVCMLKSLRQVQEHIRESNKKGKPCNIIAPQQGWQEDALRNQSRYLVIHSERGGGKTLILFMRSLSRINSPYYSGIALRKNKEDAEKGEGMIEKAKRLFCPHFGEYNIAKRTIFFKAGGQLKFDYFDSKGEGDNWFKSFADRMQGGSYTDILWDEASQAESVKIDYMFTTLRSSSKLRPRMSMACNPNPESILQKMVMSYWVGQDGFTIRERSGRKRWYYKGGGNDFVWGSTPQNVYEKVKYRLFENFPFDNINETNCKHYLKCCSFLYAPLDDNKLLLDNNPEYKASVMSGDTEQDMINVQGNWAKLGREGEIITPDMMENFFNNTPQISDGFKHSSLDPSWMGTDYIVHYFWIDQHIQDMKFTKVANGGDIIPWIKNNLDLWEVPEGRLVYDGFQANEIKAKMKKAVPILVEVIKEPDRDKKGESKRFFKNIKSQLFFKLVEMLRDKQLSINPLLLDIKYSPKETVRQVLMRQRKAIVFEEDRPDGKTAIIHKKKMKEILGSKESPDLMETMGYGMYWQIAPHVNFSNQKTSSTLKMLQYI